MMTPEEKKKVMDKARGKGRRVEGWEMRPWDCNKYCFAAALGDSHLLD